MIRTENVKDQERRTMDTDNTQGGATPSPASAGSHVVAWAVVNPSGGTRFLGLTNEDAQRVATASERVVPVCWPALTDAEREAIGMAYSRLTAIPHCEAVSATLRGLLERTKPDARLAALERLVALDQSLEERP
jgi:fructoselysine-6-P-deglycase FrlB-like protein